MIVGFTWSLWTLVVMLYKDMMSFALVALDDSNVCFGP
jgi:hypothetical protein